MLKKIIDLSRFYVLFVAASGFLFGQMFFGQFAFDATLAGLGGIVVGVFGGIKERGSIVRAALIVVFTALAFIGVGLDAYDYYAHLNIPGNYYAWFMIGPYCACLLLIAVATITKSRPGNVVETGA